MKIIWFIVVYMLLDMKYDLGLFIVKMVKEYVIITVIEGENKIVKNIYFK